MLDIRTPEEKDRQGLIDLMRVSFNPPGSWVRDTSPQIRLDRFRCAYEQERVVACTLVWRLAQWFGGRSMPTAGIAAVAALPERRGERITPGLMRAVLRESRESGYPLSTLYPSRAPFYRRLGYEYSGVFTQYRASLADLPAEAPGCVQEYVDRDLPDVQACYGRVAAEQHGFVESVDEDWWRLRVLRRANPEVTTRAVVVRGGSGVEGYATFQLEPQPEPWGFRVVCTHLISETGAATRALLAYFSGFRGLGQGLLWQGPPLDPLGHLLKGGAESISVVRSLRFMCRLLDVPGAMEARGWPQVEGEATIAVEDDLFQENNGPFQIQAQGGAVRVTRIRSGAGTPIPIGALSALVAGGFSAHDAARVGWLDPTDPAFALLSGLFPGSACWATDFF